MGFDKVTTLRLVRGLEEREYVHRALSTRDRRQHQLTLTEKGRALLAASVPLVDQAYHRLVSPLEDEELQELLRLLTKLESGLGASARVKLEPLHKPAARAVHHSSPLQTTACRPPVRTEPSSPEPAWPANTAGHVLAWPTWHADVQNAHAYCKHLHCLRKPHSYHAMNARRTACRADTTATGDKP